MSRSAKIAGVALAGGILMATAIAIAVDVNEAEGEGAGGTADNRAP